MLKYTIHSIISPSDAVRLAQSSAARDLRFDGSSAGIVVYTIESDNPCQDRCKLVSG